MQARLVIYLNGKAHLCVPLPDACAGIGRDSGNHVQLSLPEVSKRHAILQRDAKGWHIKDLASRNGLLLNGSRVQEAVVKHGDELAIGPYTLVFEMVEPDAPYMPRLILDVSANVGDMTMSASRGNPA
jgi:pSer/pThr/pTyr-binding forkhead associated (FHA) protein